MGIEEEQKMSKPREDGKPHWRYHWGNHVPEGLEHWITDVLFRDGSVGVYLKGMDYLFTFKRGNKAVWDIIAYRIM